MFVTPILTSSQRVRLIGRPLAQKAICYAQPTSAPRKAWEKTLDPFHPAPRSSDGQMSAGHQWREVGATMRARSMPSRDPGMRTSVNTMWTLVPLCRIASASSAVPASITVVALFPEVLQRPSLGPNTSSSTTRIVAGTLDALKSDSTPPTERALPMAGPPVLNK